MEEHRILCDVQIETLVWLEIQTPDPDYPIGQSVINVPIRKLAGWASGSKAQESHFLSSRTLCQHSNTDEPHGLWFASCNLRQHKQSSHEAPFRLEKFMEYCTDIKEHG